MTVAIAVAAGILLLRVPRRIHPDRGDPGFDLDGVARLLMLASSAGLTLGAALAEVTNRKSGGVIGDLRSVIRAARTDGLASALLRAPDRLRELAPSLAQAHMSGAPIVATLEAFLDRRRRQRVAEAIARARRLGVLLVIPLALMLLPGFILLVFGPFVIDNLAGLAVP